MHAPQSPPEAESMNSSDRPVDELIVIDANSNDYDRLVDELGLVDMRINLFSNGEEALRATSAGASTVWIVNIRLPDMSGISFLALVRRRTRQCSVFLVGDDYSAEDELAARLAGATAYLCKPASASWLVGCRRRRCAPDIRAGPAPFS
jgi:DNA-binding response OmpR family regulator